MAQKLKFSEREEPRIGSQQLARKWPILTIERDRRYLMESALQLTLESFSQPAGMAIWILLGSVLMVGGDHRFKGPTHWLMFVMALWVFGAILEADAGSYATFHLGVTFSHIAAVLVPPVGLLVVEYFCRKRLPKWIVYAVWAIPLATISLLLMPEWQPLIWRVQDSFELAAGPHTLVRGAWFNNVHAPYSYGLFLFGMYRLVRHAFSLAPATRFYTLSFALLAFLPMFASMLIIGGVHIPFITGTGTVIALIAPAVAWLVLRHGVLLSDMIGHHSLFQQMNDAVVVIDASEHIIDMNSAATKLFNVPVNEGRGKALITVIPELAHELKQQHKNGAEAAEFSLASARIALRVSNVTRQVDRQIVRLLICHDISSEFEARKELARNEALLRSVIHHSSNAILRVRLIESADGHQDFRVVVANPAGADLFETELDDLIDKTLARQLYSTDVTDRQYALQKIMPTLKDALDSGSRKDLEFCLSYRGAKRWYRLLADPVDQDIGLTFIDISSEREQQDALQSAALHDALTHVLNRRGFQQAATDHLSKSDDLSHGALFFIDLNDFKRINDQFGHECGDAILCEVAARLQKMLRPHDFVGRQGGDEFVVLATDTSFEDANSLRERIDIELARPYQIAEQLLNCSASVGMAIYPDEAVTLTSLLRYADASMYTEKAARRHEKVHLKPNLRIAD